MKKNKYDLIPLIFVHIPENLRENFFKKIVYSLKPNGYIIVQVYSKEQIDYGTGGPKNLELLYDLQDFRKAFKRLEIIELEKLVKTINEGELHSGLASIIEGVFRKN